MTVAAGSRLGPYEILGQIGAGGMGEVYRAKDPRLGRDVAIKVLPASFSNDPDRLRRFEQEARAAGVLNHPNITAVLDIGSHDGAPYVVQELLEGETLRSALSGGALSPRRATDYATQTSHGLAAAHEKGIVHRDLKPENLFVTQDGRIKILDFGLAKLTQLGEGSGPQTNLPTATAGTEPGVVMGTLGYMSPEQVRGRPADARSDIFAFGAILYEMLSGRRAFQGDSAADTMSAILKEDPPDPSSANQAIPPGLDRIVRHCLEKNPEQRFHAARDIAFAIDALSGTSGEKVALVAPNVRRARPGLGALLALAALAAGLAIGRLTAPAQPDPPEIRPLTFSGNDAQPTASPDGKTIAFESRRDGHSRIWLKQVVSGGEVALTEGPADWRPRFSPDGSSVLFVRWTNDRASLYRVAAVGGEARRVLADAYAADWSPDGNRVGFLRGDERGVQVGVAGTDGSGARIIAEFPGNFELTHPSWTPDGQAVLIVQGPGGATAAGILWRIPLDGRARSVVGPAQRSGTLSSVAWSGNRMVYMQGSAVTSNVRSTTGRVLLQEPGAKDARTLLSVANTAATLDVLGPGSLVFDSILQSQTLREVRLQTDGAPPVRWISRGKTTNRQPLYSPDGGRIVFASDRYGNFDIWDIDLKTGTERRLTEDPGEDWDPAISPDGRHLLWSSNRTGHFEAWIANADGSEPRVLTRDGVDAENPGMTPDGQWVVYSSANPARTGLWKIHPDGTADTRIVATILVHPEISPDGRFVLYHLPSDATRVVRLEDGKILPFLIDLKAGPLVGRARWMPDGKRIAYVGGDAKTGTVGVYTQEFSEQVADTSASRRPVAGFEPDHHTESFGISPDGTTVVLSELHGSSDILIATGVSGIKKARSNIK